ncbi:MAG: hypothetical protein WDO13_01730 [Verrucomicrobiota bacterium]
MPGGTFRGTISLRGREVATFEGLTATIRAPELWWPNGHGAQPLYDVRLELLAGGAVLDTWEKRLGLRTIVLDRHPERVWRDLPVRRQWPGDLREGRQLDPRAQLRQRGGPRALRQPAHLRRGGAHEHDPRLGRRHLREGGFLRPLRREGSAGLAGLHVRLLAISRHEGISGPGRTRGGAPGEAPGLAHLPRALVRQQRDRADAGADRLHARAQAGLRRALLPPAPRGRAEVRRRHALLALLAAQPGRLREGLQQRARRRLPFLGTSGTRAGRSSATRRCNSASARSSACSPTARRRSRRPTAGRRTSTSSARRWRTTRKTVRAISSSSTTSRASTVSRRTTPRWPTSRSSTRPTA